MISEKFDEMQKEKKEKNKRPMGIEPTTSAWKAEVIPLYDGRSKINYKRE